MTRSILLTFYLVPNCPRSFSINNWSFLELLDEVKWINALFVNENVYLNLVKVFYLNMDAFMEKENRVITNVKGDFDWFDDEKLNDIFESISGASLQIYSIRKDPEIDDFDHVEAVRNIYRCIDLIDEVCTLQFRTHCLYLKSRILLCINYNIVPLRSGNLDEVSHMDVVLIDSIFRYCLVDFGYTIFHHMLSIPILPTRSFPYSYYITRILQYFQVSINKPSFKLSKSIVDEMICGLRFEWYNRKWEKFQYNKSTFLAFNDDHPLNAMVPTDQLPNFSLLFWSQYSVRPLLLLLLTLVPLHLLYLLLSLTNLMELLLNSLWIKCKLFCLAH